MIDVFQIDSSKLVPIYEKGNTFGVFPYLCVLKCMKDIGMFPGPIIYRK